MRKTVQITDIEQREQPYCTWQGVICSDTIVYRICWKNSAEQTILSVEWLPRDVVYVMMQLPLYDNRETIPFRARALPPKLDSCYLSYMHLTGSLDCGDLPRSLVNLALPGNDLQGPLVLRNLPPHMETLNVTLNDIRSVLVDNASLPTSLVTVTVSQILMKVKLKELQKEAVDPRIRVKNEQYR